MITAIEFVDRYVEWLEQIDQVLRPEYYPAIRRMYCKTPRDLISPVAAFTSEEHAIGFIFTILLTTHHSLENRNTQHADI